MDLLKVADAAFKTACNAWSRRTTYFQIPAQLNLQFTLQCLVGYCNSEDIPASLDEVSVWFAEHEVELSDKQWFITIQKQLCNLLNTATQTCIGFAELSALFTAVSRMTDHCEKLSHAHLMNTLEDCLTYAEVDYSHSIEGMLRYIPEDFQQLNWDAEVKIAIVASELCQQREVVLPELVEHHLQDLNERVPAREVIERLPDNFMRMDDVGQRSVVRNICQEL